MHNHVILTGRLTHTPELRQTSAGVPICNFSLAVQRKYNKNKDEQETDFFEVEAWNGTAEFISRYFDKGDLIDLDGRLQTSRWTDNDGNKHSRTFVRVEHVNFAPINNRKKSEQQDNTAGEAAENPASDFEEFEEITDADIPF